MTRTERVFMAYHWNHEIGVVSTNAAIPTASNRGRWQRRISVVCVAWDMGWLPALSQWMRKVLTSVCM